MLQVKSEICETFQYEQIIIGGQMNIADYLDGLQVLWRIDNNDGDKYLIFSNNM